MSSVFKWGVIAPGSIANRFAESVEAIDDACIVAVGSRDLDRSNRFSEKWNIETAYGSYEELVKDSQVQAVYISSPHRFHNEQIQLALNAGKHVLCEKPITVNAGELNALRILANEKNLFLMEAMKSRFIPTYQKLRYDWLANKRLGDIKRIEADFSFFAEYDPQNRLFNPELAGGSLLDVGIYPITLAYWVMGRKPDLIRGLCTKAETGVDLNGTVIMQWKSGALAILTMGVDTKDSRSATILGTIGMVELPIPFYAGESMIFRNENDCEIFEEKHKKNGFEFEIEESMRCIRAGLNESPQHPWSDNIEVMEIMDEIRAIWGISYPFE